MSTCLSVCLSAYLSACLSVYLSVCMPVCLSFYLPVYLPVRLYAPHVLTGMRVAGCSRFVVVLQLPLTQHLVILQTVLVVEMELKTTVTQLQSHATVTWSSASPCSRNEEEDAITTTRYCHLAIFQKVLVVGVKLKAQLQ